MNEIRASVAMAVYNGERYIREQIDSILTQLGAEDELVISYDRSTDGTRAIIDGYAAADSRVRVVENTNPGVQNNFSNAVMACRGEYIFLSDQDDVWLEGKVERVLEAFARTGADLVVHDGGIADSLLKPTGETFFGVYGTYNSPIRNIIKGNFWGCCMAFRAKWRPLLCPFPNKHKVGHDLWIGVVLGFRGRITRIPECLMLHRIHGSNVTAARRPLPEILRHRLALIGYLLSRLPAFFRKPQD